MPELQRKSFECNGLTLSYLDSGSGEPLGEPLIALHAHWMEAATFAPLAAALAPEWRLIALDQRGHGFSSHAPTYARSDYLADLSALIDHLAIQSAVLLGNSLGGVNAYQFAARQPERVSALIIEDIGATIGDDTRFALSWAGVYPTRSALETRIGARLVPALAPSIRW
jgi:esterase